MAYGGFTTNEYVGITFAPGMNPGGIGAGITFLVIAQPTTSTGFNVHNFCCNTTDANASRFYWYNKNGTPAVGYSRNFSTTDSSAESANSTAPTSGWHAFAVVDYPTGTAPRLFTGPVGTLLNEMTYATQTAGVGNPVSEPANFRVGNSHDGSRPFHGDIFAFMYWTRALTQLELNKYARNPWLKGDQVIHFIFNNGLATTGGTVFDQGIYHNNGTVTGTLTNVQDPLLPSLNKPSLVLPFINSIATAVSIPVLNNNHREQGIA